jgi:hypothetical protein
VGHRQITRYRNQSQVIQITDNFFTDSVTGQGWINPVDYLLPGIGYGVADDRATPFVWAGLRGDPDEPRSKTGVPTPVVEKVVEIASTQGLDSGVYSTAFDHTRKGLRGRQGRK